MSTPSDSPAGWFACPSCRTLCHVAEFARIQEVEGDPTAPTLASTATVAEFARIQAACPHCGLPLGWLGQAPEFRSALALGNRAWTPRLCLLVEWPGGKTELRAEGDGPLDVTADGESPLRVRLEAACGPLVIESAGLSVELPAEVRLGTQRLMARLEAELTAAGAPRPIGRLGHFRSLKEARGEVRFGRDAADSRQDVVLSDEGVSFHHAVAVYAAAHGSYWIADAGSAEGTFVNGESIVAHRLAAGDLVQIGPFAWVFSEAEGRFEPVRGIDGLRLDFVEAGVSGRLGPLDLSIAPGQFVGVAGPSGAGKSTFLKALIGVPGHLDQGRILAEGRDAAGDRDWFRSRMGYVSQDKAIHDDLTPLEVVSFSAALRGRRDLDASSLLRQVGLERARWNARVGELSGGQEKRVRIAAELVNTPGLLVLDEPGSGLDWAREESLARLLKTLSHRGCTMIVVTHNLQRLADFDRVLILRGGQLVFDGPPEVLRQQAPSGHLAELDLNLCVTPKRSGSEEKGERRKEKGNGEDKSVCHAPRLNNPQSAIRNPQSFAGLRQTRFLVRRELVLLRNRRVQWNPTLPHVSLPQVLVPLVAVSLGFALTLHLAIKPADRPMLGFLSVISCVWMGASLSLMSIVNERDVFDHERLLFLRVGPYVAAKTIVLGGLSLLQTLIFFALRRMLTADAGLLGGFWPAVVLVLVGLAATGLGLLISAAAKRNKPLPNFIMPLVMIVQILFSVQVAGDGKEKLYRAYGEFHGHRCRVREAHTGRRRAERWLAERWRATADGDDSAGPTPGWYCSDCEQGRGRAPKKPLPPESDTHQNHMRPNLAASLGSYLTISRYGDIALRSFAYFNEDAHSFLGESDQAPTAPAPAQVRYGYRRWRIEALCALAFMIVGFPLATAAVLCRQTARPIPMLARRIAVAALGEV